MVMLHVNLVYCVPNIIKIGRHLKKQQSYEKGGRFFETQCSCCDAECVFNFTRIKSRQKQ